MAAEENEVALVMKGGGTAARKLRFLMEESAHHATYLRACVRFADDQVRQGHMLGEGRGT